MHFNCSLQGTSQATHLNVQSLPSLKVVKAVTSLASHLLCDVQTLLVKAAHPLLLRGLIFTAQIALHIISTQACATSFSHRYIRSFSSSIPPASPALACQCPDSQSSDLLFIHRPIALFHILHSTLFCITCNKTEKNIYSATQHHMWVYHTYQLLKNCIQGDSCVTEVFFTGPSLHA